MEKVYDMIIIGGGPGGYTAALYGARAGLSTLILEKMAELTNKDGAYIFGDCNGINKIIRVNINNKEGKRLKPEEIELSFYHELCHAIFGEGQYDVTNDEAFVEWSAKCIRSLKQQKVI